MMVYNCTVSSTRIDSPLIPIIDEFGCSLFPTLIPHVSYVDDLDAGLKTNAFSLDVDEVVTFLLCII
uniref:ZP domain-containing protein n=1 Tax=Ascaris lumbricoides TaxID=6252 RepID=A0A0M3IMJ2_ASCLU